MKSSRLLCALLAVLVLLCGCEKEPPPPEEPAEEESHIATLLAMDTVMKLTVYGPDGQTAADRASARIEELEALLSVTDEGSEIFAANHSEGAAVPVSSDTAALLRKALELCGASEGTLDVTVYPVVRAWGFTTGNYRVPEAGELRELLDRVDYNRVSLAGGPLTLPAGTEIDLGAVAKGYAGDQVMASLKAQGVSSAIIELGGNVQALGSKPDGSPWRVAVHAPDGSGYAGVLEIRDQAVVTSGGYERYFEEDGETYWHIIDPATGYPAKSGLASVTVVSGSGVEADALSTSLFVMGRERAAEYWRAHGGFQCILISEDGSVAVTEGLEDSFSLYGSWSGRPLEVIRSS